MIILKSPSLIALILKIDFLFDFPINLNTFFTSSGIDLFDFVFLFASAVFGSKYRITRKRFV